MPGIPLSEIVALVGGRYDGPDRVIHGVAGLREATGDQLSFLGNPSYVPQLETSRAGAILVPNDFVRSDPRFIRVSKPHAALAQVLDRWFNTRSIPRGISPLASIAPTARLGSNVTVGPFTTIGDKVVIGDETIIYSNVSIYDGSQIGRRCILHSGVVVGADGYSFVTVGGRHQKIPQIGIVRIEDDVEIGANTTIDRAALGETIIGEGTKIDNLVQVGHNVRIGKHCLIVSQVGIAGSTELGDYVVVAGQAGVAGHLKIGKGAQIGGAASVFHDVAEGAKVVGNPAIPFRDFARRDMMLKRLAKKRE